MLTRRWSLPHQATAACTARRHVATVCADLDRGDYETALLLTSELVTNAIQHSDGAIELLVATGGDRLHVEVRDDADGQPRLLEARGLSARGRGMMLVERLAERWGVRAESTASGKSVWFELRLPRGAEESENRTPDALRSG